MRPLVITAILMFITLRTFSLILDNEDYKKRYPWTNGESLHGFVANQADGEGKIPRDMTYLPDEGLEAKITVPTLDPLTRSVQALTPQEASYKLFENMGVEVEGELSVVDEITLLVWVIARTGHTSSKIILYQRLLDPEVMANLEPIMDEIYERKVLPIPYLTPFIHRVIENAPHRNAVKFAMATTGLIRSTHDTDKIITLGSHSAFTETSIYALQLMYDNPEEALWELAQRLDKSELEPFARLLVNTKNPEIQDWLASHGFAFNMSGT